MANGRIAIDPALLMSQSAEMLKLTEDYDHLFSSVSSSLTTMNTRWSANLSNNFAAKINSAGSGFSFLKRLLTGGASVARTSAERFLSVDQAFEGLKNHSSGGGRHTFSGKNETGESVSLFDFIFHPNKKTIRVEAKRYGEDKDAFEHMVKVQQQQLRDASIVVNEDAYIPDQQWLDIVPHKTNPEYRFPESYEAVLQDLQVESRGRYAPGRDTWCNIYVWDATKAMGAVPEEYTTP